MPNKTESNYTKYKKIGQYPILILNQSITSMLSIDISKRFLNKFPIDCPFTNFRISKVLSNNKEIKSY